MSIEQSGLNTKICKAIFSEEECNSFPNFYKNRDDAWMLIHKLEKLDYHVFTKQFPPVYCKIDEKINCTGSDFNEAVYKAALELIEQLKAET